MQRAAESLWKFIEGVARFFLTLLMRLFHRELTDEVFDTFMQFVRFGIVGVSNTVVSYLIYVGSLLLFRKLGWFPSVDYLCAQVSAFLLSVLWSYYWNNKMVFHLQEGQHRSWWKTLLKTYVSYSFTGLFLNSLLLYICVQLLGISEFVAPVINLFISVPLNFIFNKFWAYKSEKG